MSTNAEKLRCIQREIKFRKKVYPRLVEQGRMSLLESDYEMRTMEDIAEHFSQLVDADQRDLFLTEGHRNDRN